MQVAAWILDLGHGKFDFLSMILSEAQEEVQACGGTNSHRRED